MSNQLRDYTAEQRYVLELVAKEVGFREPVAINVDEFYGPLLNGAKKGRFVPLDGVLIRDWDPDTRRSQPGLQFGLRVYEIEGVTFVVVRAGYSDQLPYYNMNFFVVDRRDYLHLYRIACKRRRNDQPSAAVPVLPKDLMESIWQNTISFLEPGNLKRIQDYGGRPKRGVILTGPPGNGKTMACRWLWEACRQRGWEWRLVTPDTFKQARAQNSVPELFSVDRRGIVFFDDMDLALRDRETVMETDDQALFLASMDGLEVNQGVVHVFTTNCDIALIDRAFRRPGRIDLVVQFKPPDAELRRELVLRWHEEIRANVAADTIVESTEGHSFAEIEELRNLLVMHFLDQGVWDWAKAVEQFEVNRNELNLRPRHPVGFSPRRNGASSDEKPW